MARRSILAAATVAFLAFGANATPCRPTGAATSSTTLAESSSTVITETSSTTIAETSSIVVIETSTTLVESSSVTASSSTLAETSSSTTLAETSATTLAETSTTSQAPVCTVTQALVNPSFDDGDGSPWTGVSSSRSEESPRTGRYNLRYSFDPWSEASTISQTVTNLEGNYKIEFYYRVVSWVPWIGTVSTNFYCTITPKIGDTELPEVWFTNSGPYSWTAASALWTNSSETGAVDEVEVSLEIYCSGEFDSNIIALDDVTFTRVCDAPPA
ncbi:hypothetical protein NCS57_01084000 [Fusarium keratoplasticum]|uniref:Uncharacterized protein n=1 Tax=Fusarium keratoplasticum TaxID=1328300 RepID=A0ACC0QP44_9HYPO|nr:hypothetical protein NCS57_01084000 [Fusarium keratoplasticum]KAI8661047.1 hypothetical protein NCS57_01084000 [Fusarium keratoplasticum]KAI8662058.1 hypothetical protein NCS55_01078300 [Fusarium keratoplasticum]